MSKIKLTPAQKEKEKAVNLAVAGWNKLFCSNIIKEAEWEYRAVEDAISNYIKAIENSPE